MLTDYFDESLVLLKHMMEWEYKDIFYMKRFSGKDRSRKDEILAVETENLIKEHNIVDVQIYNFFHQVYRKKVTEFGEERLKQETAEFRRLRDEFLDNCYDRGLFLDNFFKWKLTKWGKLEPSCVFLRHSDLNIDFMVSELQATNDYNEPNYEDILDSYAETYGQKVKKDLTRELTLPILDLQKAHSLSHPQN